MPDPLSLARMRASRTVPMPMDQADLQALREAADAAGRRLIEVQAHNGRRHLMLGWPADVGPASALSAAGQEARTATPATLLPLAACLGCCSPNPQAPLYPGQLATERDVITALDRFTRGSVTLGPADEGGGGRWKRRCAACRRQGCSTGAETVQSALDRRSPPGAMPRPGNCGTGPTTSQESRERASDRPVGRPPHRPAGGYPCRSLRAESAHGPVATTAYRALAEPDLREAVRDLLSAAGRVLVPVGKGYTSGYDDQISARLVDEGTGVLRPEDRAVLTLVLLLCVAIPRSEGKVSADAPWTHAPPVTRERLVKNTRLNESVITPALQRLDDAGLIIRSGKGGLKPGPQLDRLTPAMSAAIFEELVLLAEPEGILADSIRRRRQTRSAAEIAETSTAQG